MGKKRNAQKGEGGSGLNPQGGVARKKPPHETPFLGGGGDLRIVIGIKKNRKDGHQISGATHVEKTTQGTLNY